MKKQLISVLALLAVLVFPAATVSAVNNNNNNNNGNSYPSASFVKVSGVGECQKDGKFKLTWSVKNESNYGKITVSQSNRAVVANGTQISWGTTKTVSETVNGTHPQSFTLNIVAKDLHNKTDADSATVHLKNACECEDHEEETPTTPEVPTPTTPGTTDEVVVGGRGGDVEEVAAAPATPQVTATPVAVNAGEGGATQSATGAIAGLMASVAALGLGVRAFVKQRQ